MPRTTTVLTAWLVAALCTTLSPSASQGPAEAIGVLIGLRNSADNFLESKNPPQIDQLRTVWIHGTPLAPIEVPNLLVPRRSGFWRVGVHGGCSEQEYRDRNDTPSGSETELSAMIVAAPVGGPATAFGGKPCTRADVHCLTESVATIVWVWPEHISVMDGGESSCGAHPGGSWVRSVHALGDAKRLSVRDVLGASAEAQYRQAFEKARQEDRAFQVQGPDDGCGRIAVTFDPRAWWIEREQGRWRIKGWTETHRLCGVGFEYAVDADMSRIAGRRADEASRWAELEARWPELQDVHTSPGAQWTVIATGEELLVFIGAGLDKEVMRVPTAEYEELVMVEWATGSNVARWNAEVARLRR